MPSQRATGVSHVKTVLFHLVFLVVFYLCMSLLWRHSGCKAVFWQFHGCAFVYLWVIMWRKHIVHGKLFQVQERMIHIFFFYFQCSWPQRTKSVVSWNLQNNNWNRASVILDHDNHIQSFCFSRVMNWPYTDLKSSQSLTSESKEICRLSFQYLIKHNILLASVFHMFRDVLFSEIT